MKNSGRTVSLRTEGRVRSTFSFVYVPCRRPGNCRRERVSGNRGGNRSPRAVIAVSSGRNVSDRVVRGATVGVPVPACNAEHRNHGRYAFSRLRFPTLFPVPGLADREDGRRVRAGARFERKLKNVRSVKTNTRAKIVWNPEFFFHVLSDRSIVAG